MVGLGRMGANMAARLRDGGHEVVGFDPHSEASDVVTLAEAVRALDAPRVVWVMVPAGEPTESTVAELAELLERGDVVVDGGNSNHHDSMRRAAALADRGIGFVDCGTSGGVWGRDNGYCLMVGGEDAHVAIVAPALDCLAPPGGLAHVGRAGAGHFTKMVHNGVEYGLMQAYAEGYELLARSDLDVDADAALQAWREGSVVQSWLLDLLVRALDQTPDLDGIAPVAEDSGEGRWMLAEAVDKGVATPVIAAALFARFTSQRESIAMKVVAALRNQFGGHAVVPEGQPVPEIAEPQAPLG
jgi:6-phosphogluconate dehydrogenase